ncbi:MAG: hypothetical protein PHH16_04870 [Candidatus Gracilibacteria bacterium]|nr:hypothetical protein [Candidatus Gracilibacteria bacterium]
MLENPMKKISPLESILVIVTIVLLIAFSVLLIRNIQLAHKTGLFGNHAPISELLLRNKETNQTSIADVDYIDTWMTFQYINFVFDIPEDSLKNTLHIEDPRYPNLPVGGYIRSKKLDKTVLLNEIKEAVREYIRLHPNK